MNSEVTAAFENEDLIRQLPFCTTERLEFEFVPDRCCIYRVPESIRRGNEELYTPVLISIGPLHYGEQKLAAMENKKNQYVKSFLQRTTKKKIDYILSFIKDNEKTIRACYTKTSLLDSSEFVMMILYDSIFIIEIFLREVFRDESDISPDKILLCADLQLFENQLPYFVLEKIYKLAGIDISTTFMQLSCNFFSDFTSVELSALRPGLAVRHFTDWRRMTLLKSCGALASTKRWIDSLPCAVKLHESGVKFKRTEEEQSLFDIKFEDHKLQIPQLSIDEGTQRLFGNVIALEQCLYPKDALVYNYVELMAHLINTKEDVDLLVAREIISNKMGDNVIVANMFKKFNVLAGPTSYHAVCEQLKRHYHCRWNRAKVNLKIETLKRVYFNNPWRGTATVAAILLLLLTIVQTVCSILQVV